jgi:hypothetical protein
MYVFILSWIGLSLFSSFLPYFSSYGEFNRFKNSIFLLVQKAHYPYSPLTTSFTLPPNHALPLAWPIFHSCPSLFRLIICQWDFYLGIIPVRALCLVSVIPSIALPWLFPHPVLFSSFQHVSLCLVPSQIHIFVTARVISVCFAQISHPYLDSYFRFSSH